MGWLANEMEEDVEWSSCVGLCYCPNIYFAWRDSVRLYVHSMTLKLFCTNLIIYYISITLKLWIRFWHIQNQPRFHSCPGFIAKLCDVCDFMLEVVHNIVNFMFSIPKC